MYQGSTKTYIFNSPIDTDLLSKIRLTLTQNNIVVEKTEADCEIEDGKLYFKLKQEDTLKFSVGLVSMQLKALAVDGITTLISQEYVIRCRKALNTEVL